MKRINLYEMENKMHVSNGFKLRIVLMLAKHEK